MVSVAFAPAGWFRKTVALSHSLVLGTLLAAGLMEVFNEARALGPLDTLASHYPMTAFAVVVAIGLIERVIRLARLAE